jgi:hypothetical protein
LSAPGLGNAQSLEINTASAKVVTATTNELTSGIHRVVGTHTFFQYAKSGTVNDGLRLVVGQGDGSQEAKGGKFHESIHCLACDI